MIVSCACYGWHKVRFCSWKKDVHIHAFEVSCAQEGSIGEIY